MRTLRILLPAFMLALVPTGLVAADFEEVGQDRYYSGSSPTMSGGAPRDVFISGFSVKARDDSTGDMHAVGFSVSVDGRTGEDLYAAGSTVHIGGATQKDLSAAGASLTIEQTAAIGGNARLAGGTVTLNAPVAGALVAAAGEFELNSIISGDVRLQAGRITLGPDAKIGGTLKYSAPEQIAIPASVIDPSRVSYEKLERPAFARGVQNGIEKAIPSFWPSFLSVIFGGLLMLAFLLLVAAFFLSFTPDRVKAARLRAGTRPGLNILFGFFGLAALIGLVPVSGMTLVGIPFIPIVILLIVVLWMLGYLLGVYTVAMRLREAFTDAADSLTARLLTLAAGILVLAILNFIPVVGWLINLTIVLLGLGGLTWAFVEYLSHRPELQLATSLNGKSETGKATVTPKSSGGPTPN